VVVDPREDGLAVLRARGSHRDERPGLREDVLVQRRRPLRDERDADATESAALDERLERADELRGLAEDALGDVLVGFFAEHVERFGVAPVEPVGEVGEEPALVGLGHLGDVEDAGDALLGDEVGDETSGGRLERDVAVQAAEHEHRQAGRLAVAGGADAPPVALRVDGDPRHTGVVHLLGHHDRGVRLAGALHREDRERLGDGVERQVEPG
jgi:hypothetical protein